MMGSFASTCCVSGLPIEDGDPVRYFLLTENPYGGMADGVHGRWVPRTWPIKAKYNDYGSIEEWEEGPLLDVIMQGFQQDLVEVGTGNNCYHDPPARKAMPFKGLLHAVWEGRVRVHRKNHPVGKHIGEGTPTLARVEALLAPVEAKFLVDEPEDTTCAWVRVRCDGFKVGEAARQDLLQAKGVLDPTYAVALTAGSGNYAAEMELRVFMAPGRDSRGHPQRDSGVSWGEAGPLQVRQAMIREDVWQALIGMSQPRNYGPEKDTIADYRAGVRTYLASPELALNLKYGLSEGNNQLGAYLLAQDLIPYDNGLKAHFLLLHEAGKVDEAFMDLAAEFVYLMRFLGKIRYLFQPSEPSGPQFGEYKLHSAYHRALVKISVAAGKRREG